MEYRLIAKSNHLFRHKTKHWYFRYGLPLLLLIHIGLGLWLAGVVK